MSSLTVGIKPWLIWASFMIMVAHEFRSIGLNVVRAQRNEEGEGIEEVPIAPKDYRLISNLKEAIYEYTLDTSNILEYLLGVGEVLEATQKELPQHQGGAIIYNAIFYLQQTACKQPKAGSKNYIGKELWETGCFPKNERPKDPPKHLCRIDLWTGEGLKPPTNYLREIRSLNCTNQYWTCTCEGIFIWRT